MYGDAVGCGGGNSVVVVLIMALMTYDGAGDDVITTVQLVYLLVLRTDGSGGVNIAYR